MNSLVSIFNDILYLGLTGSILIAIILISKKIFSKGLSPKWQYYIWILVIIRLLIPFYPQSSVSVYNIFYLAEQKINLSVNQISIPFQGVSFKEGTVDKITVPPKTTAKVSNEGIDKSDVTHNANNTSIKVKDSSKYYLLTSILSIAWIIGVLILSMYTICINIIFAVKVHKNYKFSRDGRLNFILKECKDIMKIKHNISLLTCDKARTPSLYGFFNTKILVSETYMDKLSDAEIKYVFLHELSHYKRNDIVVNWILALLQIVYFFNPLIWYAFYKIHEDCEISCDASALRYINEKEYQTYGATIIKLIKLFSESNFIPVTVGISKNKSSYKRRIIMINKFKKNKWYSTLLAVILIACVGFIGLTGCNLSKNNDSSNNSTVINKPNNDTGKNTTAISTNNTPSSDTSNSSEVYKSTKLGLSITFPTSWKDKYTVKENKDGLYVYFKPKAKVTDGQGLFFCILNKTKDLNEDMYDSINGKKDINVNGVSYLLGGPTDIGFPDDNPEFKTYTNLKTNIADIINSIKAIK